MIYHRDILLRNTSIPIILIVISAFLFGCSPATTAAPSTHEPDPVQIASPTSTPDPTSWELVWSDEFNQSDGTAPDPAKWNHQQGGSGWGNGELEYYTDSIDNSYIDNGMLVIKAINEYEMGRDYTSARLTTQFKGDWTYGRFEIRAKLPNTQGIWPAFWLLPSRARYGSGPAGGEIDIMELIGSEPGRSYATLHYGNPPERSSGYYNLPIGETYADDFHTFAVEWEPDEIRWYLDDTLFHTATEWFTSARKDAQFPAPYDQDFYLIVNVAVGGTWPGSPDETSLFPQMMYVDYVRVYQHPK
jgi:beta-glucanase (GH16 family)